MSLIPYKGDANRDYENSFFREFTSNLMQMFEEEDLDGIIVGHPFIPAKPYLKPDCVLITPNRLVIVDFKNHDGRLWLPSEESFEDTVWRHDGVTIEGGNSINPFTQLKKQRDWMEELISREQCGKAGIACMVCFQQDMKIMNEVPGRYQRWFSVTNRYQYLNRIKDIIGVENDNPIDMDEVFAYFEAKPYHEYYPVSLENVETVNAANERLIAAEARETEAQEKVAELETKIAAAESAKRSVERLKDELSKAKQVALESKKLAEKEKKEFDDKKYNLDLETQKAIRAKEEADKARLENKKAEHDLEREKVRSRGRKLLITAVTLIVLVGIATAIGLYVNEQNKIAQQKEEQLAQLEADYQSGRKCIPIERVADFLGSKNVCVEFRASYINDSRDYVFIDNAKNGTFALMIPKTLISEAEARSNYLNKLLEARGSITKYENTHEIKITDLSQISIK